MFSDMLKETSNINELATIGYDRPRTKKEAEELMKTPVFLDSMHKTYRLEPSVVEPDKSEPDQPQWFNPKTGQYCLAYPDFR